MITNETLKVIKQRRSVRTYKEDQIKDEELQAILEAGQYAPNAGDQEWHFTVIQNKETLGRLNDIAKEFARQTNVEDLRALGENEKFNCFYGAPTAVIVSAKEHSHVPLDADCAAATQNLLLAAESLGLGSCWVFFDLFAFMTPRGPELLKELKIPAEYKPYTSVALGYKQDESVSILERKPDRITYIR